MNLSGNVYSSIRINIELKISFHNFFFLYENTYTFHQYTLYAHITKHKQIYDFFECYYYRLQNFYRTVVTSAHFVSTKNCFLL